MRLSRVDGELVGVLRNPVDLASPSAARRVGEAAQMRCSVRGIPLVRDGVLGRAEMAADLGLTVDFYFACSASDSSTGPETCMTIAHSSRSAPLDGVFRP